MRTASTAAWSRSSEYKAVSAKRCLGSVKGGIEKVDARTSSVDSDLDPSHGFGNCECFCQAQIPH